MCFSSSPATKSLIKKFNLESFKYESELINVPIMMATSNDQADQGICPYNENKENYDKISEKNKKVIGVRKGVDHGDMQ